MGVYLLIIMRLYIYLHKNVIIVSGFTVKIDAPYYCIEIRRGRRVIIHNFATRHGWPLSASKGRRFKGLHLFGTDQFSPEQGGRFVT